jgi:hypothetical protein
VNKKGELKVWNTLLSAASINLRTVESFVGEQAVIRIRLVRSVRNLKTKTKRAALCIATL